MYLSQLHFLFRTTPSHSRKNKGNKCLFVTFHPLNFTHKSRWCLTIKLWYLVLLTNTQTPDWIKQRDGTPVIWKCLLIALGVRRPPRFLLTESTQPRAALQVINTLLTVVGGLLSTAKLEVSTPNNPSLWIWNTKPLLAGLLPFPFLLAQSGHHTRKVFECIKCKQLLFCSLCMINK